MKGGQGQRKIAKTNVSNIHYISNTSKSAVPLNAELNLGTTSREQGTQKKKERKRLSYHANELKDVLACTQT